MKITGKQEVEIEVSESQIAWAIMSVILKKLGEDNSFDDAGCDWITYHNYTYIGGKEWFISKDTEIADLVNAMNIIRYGKRLILGED